MDNRPSPNAWTTKLTPDEMSKFVVEIAEIVVAAHTAGLLTLGPYGSNYWDQFDLGMSAFTGTRPLDSLVGVLRFQTTHELRRSHFHSVRVGLPYLAGARYLPSRSSGVSLGEDNIFHSSVVELAQEAGCFDYSSARPEPLNDESYEGAWRSLAERFEAVMAPLRAKIADDEERHDAEEARKLDEARRAREEFVRSRSAPAPHPQPYGVSPRGAEMIVTEWMRYLGILDAEITRATSDGGVDVTSNTHVAQVKHYQGKVGVAEVRQLFGVAAAQRKEGLFFTSTGYTSEAVAFATATEMPIFTYSVELGELNGVNKPAIRMI